MLRRRLIWLGAAAALGYPFAYACAALAGVHRTWRPLVALAMRGEIAGRGDG